MELTRYCPWCKRDMILSHDHLCCWYRTHVLTMDNVQRQCEIEKLEYWLALPPKEEITAYENPTKSKEIG